VKVARSEGETRQSGGAMVKDRKSLGTSPAKLMGRRESLCGFQTVRNPRRSAVSGEGSLHRRTPCPVTTGLVSLLILRINESSSSKKAKGKGLKCYDPGEKKKKEGSGGKAGSWKNRFGFCGERGKI